MPRFEPRFDGTCSACKGLVECKGGGNLLCRKRDPHASHLAGILDTYGGLRFVVAHKKSFVNHVRPDEVLIVVPDLTVHEPIAWNDIPMVITRIELTVDKWVSENNPNEPHAQEAARMYRLRCLENPRRVLDLNNIVET